MWDVYGEPEIQAVIECLKKGWLGGQGLTSEKFEQEIAKIFGKKYGVFVNSGSSANLLALASLNLPKGIKVITPACTFNTTAAPIIQLGLEPVFCDVGLNTYVASLWDFAHLITDEVKVIMLPNLVGNKPNWKLIKEYLKHRGRQDIVLIEDSCDTITTTPESDISTTSFYASHIITAGGTGGMVMFNNKYYKKIALKYRDWGRRGGDTEDMDERFNHSHIQQIPYDFKFLYEVLGYNMKGSEMEAAFGLEQLNRLKEFQHVRRCNFERYLKNLKDVEDIILPDDGQFSNWLAIPLQIPTLGRTQLLKYLEDNNIQTRVCFAGNITRHPAYFVKYFEFFKNSDKIMEHGFLLGCHQGMSFDDIDYVCNLIKEYVKNPMACSKGQDKSDKI